MSFDLAVWYEPHEIDSQTAQKQYKAIGTGTNEPAPHKAVAEFVKAVTQKYPLDFEEDEDRDEDSWYDRETYECPWACEFDVSPGHCILNFCWGMQVDLVDDIISMAIGLGLTCYDPQSYTVHSPHQNGPLQEEE